MHQSPIIAAKSLALPFSVLFGVLVTQTASSQSQDLAATPPMGWNSWNKFGCNVSEKLVKETADAMVSSGMRDVGYNYVIMDDCWQVARDKAGNIVADPKRFPSGIKALSDYVHSKGLKFGLYSDAGTGTCENRPGSYGHEMQDATQYAKWGVDYLKYDFCNAKGLNQETQYRIMSKALKATGRPIVFSICEWGSSNPWYWAKDVGNLWRTAADITDCFSCTGNYAHGWTTIIDEQEGLEKYAGKGHWNDPDMLEVGNGGQNQLEQQGHFAFWCLLAAPLIAGNDIRSLQDATKSILVNKESIAIDQDALGIQGSKKLDEGRFEVWTKMLNNGDVAVCMLNRGEVDVNRPVSWTEIGLNGSYKIRDIWHNTDLPSATSISQKIRPHETLFLRLSRN